MEKENIVATKSYAFALRIIKFYQSMKAKNEFDIGRQLLRSGTSIGANVQEAIGGQSRKDFHAKISISYKEARETAYWLRLVKDSEILPAEDCDPMIADIDELVRILGSIKKTTSTGLK
jgi:four helix bundle protein